MNKKAIAASFLSKSGVRSMLGRTLQWSGVLTLNYHRVGDCIASQFDRGLWSASAQAFTDQIRFCKAHLEMITPDDLSVVRTSAPGRYGMITFDDGYRDNYDVAFQILKKEGIKAAFFITTGFIDSPRVPWWDEIAWMVRMSQKHLIELPGWIPEPISFDDPDREQAVRVLLRAYKEMPANSTCSYLDAIAEATRSGRYGVDAGNRLWMTWDMIREMHNAGMTIGGHTVTHPVLARSSREQQREEIAGCGKRLYDEIGKPMRYFSYPVGGKKSFNTITREVLRETGIQSAFSYYGGFRRFSDWDDYDIRRVPVEMYLTPDWFKSIISLPDFFA